MYIDKDDRRAVVVDTVNWLIYLNYEAIACFLIGCHYF